MTDPKMTVSPRPADPTRVVPAAERDYWKQRAAALEHDLEQLLAEREQIRQALQPIIASTGAAVQQAIAHLDQAWPGWRTFAEAISDGGDRG